LRPAPPWADNRAMAKTSWQRRIQRAEELAAQHAFAAEMLGFYVQMARFQEGLYHRLENAAGSEIQVSRRERLVGPPELPELISSFGTFLTVVEEKGPARLAETACELRSRGDESWWNCLDACWSATETSAADAQTFLARAFLQPYAEFVRSRVPMQWDGYTYSLCPFCNRKPGLGILHQQGDGARRSLLCSFCVAEWEFRRIVCPGCGEEDNRKLPVYTADEFGYIRVECCDSCKRYIKTVDLTKNGRAEPVVDEIASAPLDLWAQDHGYSKLELNVVGM
jgi:formate dehydrogenase accessory protein FdhE